MYDRQKWQTLRKVLKITFVFGHNVDFVYSFKSYFLLIISESSNAVIINAICQLKAIDQSQNQM